jgi:hypothetical protein
MMHWLHEVLFIVVLAGPFLFFACALYAGVRRSEAWQKELEWHPSLQEYEKHKLACLPLYLVAVPVDIWRAMGQHSPQLVLLAAALIKCTALAGYAWNVAKQDKERKRFRREDAEADASTGALNTVK